MTEPKMGLRDRYFLIGRPDWFRMALRLAMEDDGWSQAQVAEELNITQPTVSGWVRGRVIPDPPTVFALEDLLNTPPGHLSRHLGYVPATAAHQLVDDATDVVDRTA